MPVINFHLIENAVTAQQEAELLKQSAQLYAEVLKSPVERIRAFITYHSASQFFAAGDQYCNNGLHAPYFEFIVLEGRPLAQRQSLLGGFTALLVDVLGVERQQVRGMCRRVDPEDWAIGGVPASKLRKDEIQARQLTEKADQ